MRCATILVAACVAVALFGQAVIAAPLTFSAHGPANFDGDLPATALGGIALPEGQAVLTGNSIEINAVPDWLFDKQPVLNGVVFGQQVDSRGSNPKVTGQAYFMRGDWLKELGSNTAPEVVSTTDGHQFSGHVVSATATTLELTLSAGTRKSLPLETITAIVSPRAFIFEIATQSLHIQPAGNSYAADATDIQFTPVSSPHNILTWRARKPQVPKSTLPGTEFGISNKDLAFLVANDIVVNTVANAVAIPVVFSRPESLHTRQLLFFNGNASDGQPLFAPQVFANGSVHFFPTK